MGVLAAVAHIEGVVDGEQNSVLFSVSHEQGFGLEVTDGEALSVDEALAAQGLDGVHAVHVVVIGDPEVFAARECENMPGVCSAQPPMDLVPDVDACVLDIGLSPLTATFSPVSTSVARCTSPKAPAPSPGLMHQRQPTSSLVQSAMTALCLRGRVAAVSAARARFFLAAYPFTPNAWARSRLFGWHCLPRGYPGSSACCRRKQSGTEKKLGLVLQVV